ncbi:unnamed protein product [Prunus armeniaca]
MFQPLNKSKVAPAVGQDQVLVEDITEVTGGPVLRPNPATSLELQQLIRVMETMAQTMATQNAQINERFDQWLDQQNGQNGNQGAPNRVPALGPQVQAQPNGFGVNPPQPNPPTGGNPPPVINVPPMGNNPYAVIWCPMLGGLVGRSIGGHVQSTLIKRNFRGVLRFRILYYFREMGSSRPLNILADSQPNVRRLGIVRP